MAKSRRDIFNAFSSKRGEVEEAKVRLPYCDDLSLFQKHCIECEDKPCVNACEQEIILIDESGLPYLTFERVGCTFCDECAIVCPKEFMDVSINKIQGTIELDILQCMAWHGTICFSCKEPCIDDAINFLGMFRPEIDTQKCTNCGYCLKVCPVDAITIKGV